MADIVVGSRVAYSVGWLRSTGQQHTPIAHARGTVTALRDLGPIRLAEVDWGTDEFPGTVAVGNLAVVGLNTRFCAC